MDAFPVATSAFGALQSTIAIAKLLKLEKQGVEEFKATPALMKSYSRAADMANAGFTPQETAAFLENVYKNNASQYRLAVGKSGGSFAGAVQAGIDFGNVEAFGTFSTQDAMLRRRNIAHEDALAGELQNIADRNTQTKIAAHMAEQNAWGGALSAGINNMFLGAAMIKPKGTTPPVPPPVTADGGTQINTQMSFPVDLSYEQNSPWDDNTGYLDLSK